MAILWLCLLAANVFKNVFNINAILLLIVVMRMYWHQHGSRTPGVGYDMLFEAC